MTPTSEFINTVRAATERFKDVAMAEAEGYTLRFGCVSGPDWGAMGLQSGTFSNWHSKVSCDAFSGKG